MSQKARSIGRRLEKLVKWVRGGILRGPLAAAKDEDIDAALSRLRLTRSQLFRPSFAIADHRRRMAHMLLTRGVDVGRAVAEHWQELKNADGGCAACANIHRCERWLEWAWHDDAPQVFCSNTIFFATLRQHRDGQRPEPLERV